MMKDKLEKTGHKAHYQRGKKLLLSFAALLALGGVAAIPVGISYQVATAEAKAEAAEPVESEDSIVETEAAFN